MSFNEAAGHAAPENERKRLHSDLNCTICLMEYQDAFMTSCGHSFCHNCIQKQLTYSKKCPQCLKTVTNIYPNHILDRIVDSAGGTPRISSPFFSDNVIEYWTEKEHLVMNEKMVDFLLLMRERKKEVLFKTEIELAKINQDLALAGIPLEDDQQVSEIQNTKYPQDLYNSYLEHPFSHFSEILNSVTKYSRIVPFSKLARKSIFPGNNIVSSISFDKDSELFSLAGTRKKIQIFNHSEFEPSIDIYSPMLELDNGQKISCTSWSPFDKSKLVSCDYEGIVKLWDLNNTSTPDLFEEHEKRAWSVDWSRMRPEVFASGSDDTRLKIWNANEKKSLLSIDFPANICSVKFDPDTDDICIGSADHTAQVYDLRNPKEPKLTLKGHSKAVSFVKYTNSNEIVTASTDSTLRVWDTFGKCLRVLSGHINERNFVGLDVYDDSIICGSETNTVHLYNKNVQQAIATFKFSDQDLFVSSVAFKDKENIVCANSQGTVCLLKIE